LIFWVLEGYDVMGVSGDALSIFAGWEHILAQMHDGDVPMMRIFGEQIQRTFVVSSLFHEIIQHW